MSLLPPSVTVKILEIIHLCVQRVLNTIKNSELSHIYMLLLLVIIFVLAAMLCTLSCGNSRCTECHAIYVKPMVLPFLSPALIIIVAELRGRS